MAVEDKYTHANFSGNRLTKLLPAIACGIDLKVAFATVEIAAADSDGSVYRFFKALDPSIIPIALMIASDGITGGTVFDFGFHKTDLGAVIDADALAANLDLSSAVDFGFATALDGMDAVDIANYGKKLYELAGHTISNMERAYDLTMTGDTVGTGAGTVSVIFIYGVES